MFRRDVHCVSICVEENAVWFDPVGRPHATAPFIFDTLEPFLEMREVFVRTDLLYSSAAHTDALV